MKHLDVKIYKIKYEINVKKQFAIGGYFICKSVSLEKVCRPILKKIEDQECFKIDQRDLNQTKTHKFHKDFELTKVFLNLAI